MIDMAVLATKAAWSGVPVTAPVPVTALFFLCDGSSDQLTCPRFPSAGPVMLGSPSSHHSPMDDSLSVTDRENRGNWTEAVSPACVGSITQVNRGQLKEGLL